MRPGPRGSRAGGPLLLAAQSARLLAQSAARAGLPAVALDHFADADTRRLAAAWLALPPGAGDEAWLEAAETLAPAAPLVYGGGLDTRPGLVAKLARGRELFGNPPAVLRLVHDPRRFFRLLRRLAIPHPATRFSPPADPRGWLVKPRCGQGGEGVGLAPVSSPPPAGFYYQRQIPGQALSALFLADGRAARLVGCNTQWTAGHDPARPFLFAGAVNRAGLDAGRRGLVEDYAGRLAEALGLVGLNSLDFMLEEGTPKVLELNPRPSATLALYDEDFPAGLLAAHIAACRGRLPAAIPPGPARALRIVYAPGPLAIKEGFDWPAGAADLPNPGAAISAGEPLCSLLARVSSMEEAEDLLKNQEAELLRRLPLGGPREP